MKNLSPMCKLVHQVENGSVRLMQIGGKRSKSMNSSVRVLLRRQVGSGVTHVVTRVGLRHRWFIAFSSVRSSFCSYKSSCSRRAGVVAIADDRYDVDG
jgi:hypothetical protein